MIELSAFIAIIVSLMGPVLASFFAAKIMRETSMTKATSSRSQCDHCGHELAVVDLIPIVSYIWQRGKCRYCGATINIKIWLAEVLGLVMFMIFSYDFAVRHLLTFDSIANVSIFVGLLTILVTLLYLAVYDLLTLTIPAKPLIVLLGIVAGLNLYALLYPQLNLIAIVPEWGLAGNLFAATLLGLGVWGIVKLTKEKGIGMGDVYLFAILGLFGGPVFSVSLIYLTIGYSLVIGLAQAVKLRKLHGVIVPLVPFLALAWVTALAFGEVIFKLLFPSLVS